MLTYLLCTRKQKQVVISQDAVVSEVRNRLRAGYSQLVRRHSILLEAIVCDQAAGLSPLFGGLYEVSDKFLSLSREKNQVSAWRRGEHKHMDQQI